VIASIHRRACNRDDRPMAIQTDGRSGATVAAELMPEPAGPDERLDAHENLRLAFLSAVSGLPPRQRAALILRDGAGPSALEIADLRRITLPAVNISSSASSACTSLVGDAQTSTAASEPNPERLLGRESVERAGPFGAHRLAPR
jgi:DNA-directed RNA polymerase specialized sigma24 family protein